MITIPVCFFCKHFNEEEGTCKAFPKKIPYEIIMEGEEHKKPLKDQKNNIVFEKKNK